MSLDNIRMISALLVYELFTPGICLFLGSKTAKKQNHDVFWESQASNQITEILDVN